MSKRDEKAMSPDQAATLRAEALRRIASYVFIPNVELFEKREHVLEAARIAEGVGNGYDRLLARLEQAACRNRITDFVKAFWAVKSNLDKGKKVRYLRHLSRRHQQSLPA
jgi:hypothetical protein